MPVSEAGAPIGQFHHRAVYTDAEIDELFKLWDAGISCARIAVIMEMPKSTVWAVTHGYLRGKTPAAWKRRKV